MQYEQFRTYLEVEKKYTQNAVNTRLKSANQAEEILGKSLDVIVADDDKMYDALMTLRQFDDLAHAPRQNALRKYYEYVRGKSFPQLRQYKK